MEIKIEEQEDLYCVCVKIEQYNTKIKRKTIVITRQVRRELAAQGYELGEAVQKAYLHNLNGVTQGTWFFKKKVLDKPVEPVIIEEEKQVKPKTTRKRRTRSSTKKVSTEE